MKKNILFILIWMGFIACQENKTNTRPLVMGDSSTIVNETNDFYRQNNTEDISPTNKKSSEGEIRTMMVQVDSLKTVQKLESQSSAVATAPLSGFTINFSECEVVFNGLSAHALQNTQDERRSNSVSYLRDGGNFNEMALTVSALQEIKVEQRLFTKLFIELNGESFELNDLGKFISTWYSLAGKDNKFISLGINGLQFFDITNDKLVKAFDRELRKKKKTRQEIQKALESIKNTQTFSDVPCLVKIVASQWRIIGKANGKRVQKLIQFDIP